MLYPVLLDRAVAASPDTRFIQRLVTKEYTPGKGQKPSPDLMRARRRAFLKSCNRFLAERSFPWTTRLIVKAATWPYVSKRTYRVGTLIHQYILGFMSKGRNSGDRSREEYL
jgi:hypothetical protein